MESNEQERKEHLLLIESEKRMHQETRSSFKNSIILKITNNCDLSSGVMNWFR